MRNLSNSKLKTLLMTFSLWTDQRLVFRWPPLAIPVLTGYLNIAKYPGLSSKILNAKEYKDLQTLDILRKEGRQRSLNSVIDCGINHKINKTSAFHKAAELLLRRHQPDLIGFSVCYYEQLFYALQMSRIMKLINPKSFIVLGGPIITQDIDRLLKHDGISKLIDGMVMGDGEEPLVELIYHLERRNCLDNVPNLYWKNKQKNFKKSKKSFEHGKEHIIAPDFGELKIERVPLQVSIGCPWGRCSFCNFKSSHKIYEILETKKIIEMIKELSKKYPNDFIFYDNSFLPHHLKLISEAIINKGLKLRWEAPFLELHSGFLDERIIRLMKKAGCYEVGFGLESISPRILRLMNKRQQDPQTSIKILKLFKKVGIEFRLFTMFGFPSETKKEAMATFNFLKENRDLYKRVRFQHFCLQEHTEIFENPSDFQIAHIDIQDKYLGIRGSQRYGFRYETIKGMTEEESKELSRRVEKYQKFFNTADIRI